MPDIPAGRRPIEKNEHLFLTSRKKRCSPHLWINTQLAHSGPVVACSVCGKLKQGETLPVDWPVLVP